MSKVLVPEDVARQDGSGAGIALDAPGQPLELTLGITRIVEQESLEISVWGSPDSDNWRLLATFPHKFYCGTYSLPLDLARSPEVRFLRAEWRMRRWGQYDTAPLFGFYLVAEERKLLAMGA